MWCPEALTSAMVLTHVVSRGAHIYHSFGTCGGPEMLTSTTVLGHVVFRGAHLYHSFHQMPSPTIRCHLCVCARVLFSCLSEPVPAYLWSEGSYWRMHFWECCWVCIIHIVLYPQCRLCEAILSLFVDITSCSSRIKIA